MWVCVDHGPIGPGRRCTEVACGGGVQVVGASSAGFLVVLVSVSGEVDLAAASAVDDALTAASAARPDLLVVDVSRLGFCGVRGIESLSRAARAVETQGGRFRIIGLSSRLARVWGLVDGTQPPRHTATIDTPAGPRRAGASVVAGGSR